MLLVVSVHENLHIKPAEHAYFGQTKAAFYVRTVVAAIFYFMTEEDWGEYKYFSRLRVNNTGQKDSRQVLETTFRFGCLSEILGKSNMAS